MAGDRSDKGRNNGSRIAGNRNDRDRMAGDGATRAGTTKAGTTGKVREKSNTGKMDFRIGHGYDVHVLEEGRKLVLGGVEIPHTKGFVAHSDGDVAIHALCDALLGAAALGDIGLHFPDTSDDYAGIDSKILLRRVVGMLREKGYEIGNVDCTIRMQRPKLRPHVDAMREALAAAMEIGVDRVSVKATTTERLGFEGREEGVSVSAVALIYRP